MRTVLLSRQALAITAVGALGVLSAPAVAAATAHPAARAVAGAGAVARPALPAGQRYACPPARPGRMTCFAIVRTAVAAARMSALAAAASPQASGPYRPVDLRRAYKLVTASATRGRGRTIAIVDAFSDPRANADLKAYRHFFRLPACTTSNGCLHIYNEHGNSKPLPRADAGWAVEESLDLDMASAICPRCHIDLIEASNASDVNLAITEKTAAAKAKYVSNSWGNAEMAGQDVLDHYFNHPGHVIDFASGDLGYGTTFPADLQYVTAIGGTSLRHARNGRGWTESVWGSATSKHGTASGCSAIEAKPSWQRVDAKAGGCFNRTENDASADANPATGVIVNDTYQAPGGIVVGGTSAATPIITAIYALAGAPVRNTYPAQYPYLKTGHLFDVTAGANGTCPEAYLCHGERGFDGPTGLGTPNGTAGFSIRAITRVTVVDPGTQTGSAGAPFKLTIIGLDTRKVSSLFWTETGLPASLSIHKIPNTTNGQITGTLPTTPGSFRVTVTAHDGKVSSSTRFIITVQ